MSENERPFELSELKVIANYLREKQDDILEEWEANVIEHQDDQMVVLASLSRRKFYNDIPEFMEQVRESLRGNDAATEHLAREHGAQRWKHGLYLREVVHEWGLLHGVVARHIVRVQAEKSISPGSLAEALRRIMEYIHEGIRLSVEEYYELQQRAAEGKLHDLEEVLEEQEQGKEQRGKQLQQASHDLKGSVTAIRTNLYLLDKTELNEQASTLVGQLNSATESLTELLKDLLDLSRLEAGREIPEITTFDVTELLKSTAESVQPVAKSKNLELKAGGIEELSVQGDQLKVQRIAQNLLLNSLKYTEKGYVEMTWKPDPEDHNFWELNIRDTGPGFDYSKTAIYSRRSPAEPERDDESEPEEILQHSEGIGLLIVRELCDLLNAIITIDSNPETGTHFRIVFPANYPQFSDG